MPFASFQRGRPGRTTGLIVATAVHNGHALRPEVAELMLVDSDTRLREEDPFTDFFATAFDVSAIVHRSRFEVDLNRPRAEAVYSEAEDAWGLDLWKVALPLKLKAESLRLYDRFYSDLGKLLDQMVSTHGGFVLYDIHSYNHRRGGPEAAPALESENPVVNLGTGSMPERWRKVADAFTEAMSNRRSGGEFLAVGENVRFKGRQVAAFVHERYGEVGCALALEFKKVWMDEWTGAVDAGKQLELRGALLATMGPVSDAWMRSAGH